MVFDDTPCLNNMTMQLRNNNSFTILGINHIHMHLPAFSLRLSSGCSPYSNIMFYFQGFLCLPCNTRGKDDRKRCVEVMEGGIGYGQHQWCMIAPPSTVSAPTLNKGGRPWTSLVLLKMLSETWPRLKITNLKSNMEAFPPCILQSLKENLIFFHFVFGAEQKGLVPSICFFFINLNFFTQLVSHVPHGPHGTLEAPFRYEQSFRFV